MFVNRLFALSCVLALGLLVPALGQDKDKAKAKDKDKGKTDENPAAKKLDRNIERHKLFLQRVEDSKREAVLKEILGDKYPEYLKRVKETKVVTGDVVFLGDSITHGWEGQKAWEANFGEFKPVNLGIGGDQTGHVLWRITDGKELAHLNPKVAVIMIGTNNAGVHSAEQIAGGIKAIIDELKKQKPGIKILLLGVFPRTAVFNKSKDPKFATPEEFHPKIKAINDIISKYDDAKTVFYKDIGKEFLDKDGNMPKDVMYDYLHLTAKGYDAWGKAIKEDIAKLLK